MRSVGSQRASRVSPVVRRLATALAAIVIAVGAVAHAAAPADLFDEIYKKGQPLDATIKTIRAKFTETTTSSLLKEPLVAEGTLLAVRPSDILLTYTKPERKLLRIDAKTLLFIWPDKKLRQTGPATLAWEALTTGGFGGFDAWLADPRSGALRIDTPLVKCEIAIDDIGLEDLAFEAGGIGRRIRVFRLPDENPHRRLLLSRRVTLKAAGDNALYVCLTQEDGHLVWSSPIYVFR